MRLAVLFLLLANLLAAQGSPDVVISQIYGGGGNSGAILRNDFIELFNRGASPVNLTGWSVQYTSATGTDWQTTALNGTIQPGGYYLIREAEGANTAAADLPTPDATGSIAMSSTAGKVQLVRPSVVDLVGYGTANLFEGLGPARALSNTTAAVRRGNGCIDTDDNNNDFNIAAPTPRNSQTMPLVNCHALPGTTTLRISQIQGSGATSPVTGQQVVTSGVVTGLRNNGLWIQSMPADEDGNPATSEGLWVFFAAAPPGSIRTGHFVRVTGTVSEFRPASDPGSPTLTELIDPRAEILSQGQPLPAPVMLTPDTDWERYEGMRVAVPELRTVSGTLGSLNEQFNIGVTNGVFYGVLPGQARPYRSPDADDVPQRIRVDSAGQAGIPINVSTGAVVRNLVGPLDFAFRTYSIVQDPLGVIGIDAGPPVQPVLPATSREFSIAAANLQRFFDDVDDPGTSDAVLTSVALQNRITKISSAIRNVLQLPDVLAVEEVENLSVLQRLAAAIGDYDAQLFEGNDIGGIDVGLLTKRGRVQVLSAAQEGKETMLGANRLWDRPPLAVRLRIENTDFTAIVVHLRSLIDADTATVAAKRQAQAEALRDIVAARVRSGEQVVVLGDFNMFQFDPLMNTIRSGGPLTNLTDTLPPNENYSYVEDGVTQTLDHMLVTGGMLDKLLRVQFVHLDADYPVSLRSDLTRTERTSDHDFPVAWFSLAPQNVQLKAAGITNGATFLTGSVAPLEIVTIFGRNIGPNTLVEFPAPGPPTSLGGTRILFDGESAGIIYTSTNQVSVVVPQSVAGKSSVTVQAEFQGRLASDTVVVPVAATAPGIFSLDRSGRGQGAILNQDSSVNGPGNPAARDSVIQIFATGGGLLGPGSGSSPARLTQPATVRIGGRPAEVTYAGQAPELITGVIQINARVPADIPPGNARVVVSMADRTSSFDVTVAVR